MVATYDPQNAKVMFGPIPVTGFATGSMIRIQHQGDGVKSEVGTAGEAAFLESRNRSAIVEVTLMSTAASNAALWVSYQAGNPPLPLAFADLSTNSFGTAPAAKIERIPDQDLGADVPTRVWKFICPVWEDVIGLPL